MKRWILTMVALMTIVFSASAMSYSKARTQALFLTDKMGYELNLSDDQYNAVYEINLDYLMCIDFHGDIFGFFWERRNSELQYVLSAYQYQRFIATEYFYRPYNRMSNEIRFVVYSHYPKNRYYLNAPRVYDTYKGGNRQYQYSPYKGRTYSNEPNRNVRQQPKGSPMPPPQKSKSQAVKGARQEQRDRQQTTQPRQQNGNSHFGNRR